MPCLDSRASMMTSSSSQCTVIASRRRCAIHVHIPRTHILAITMQPMVRTPHSPGSAASSSTHTSLHLPTFLPCLAPWVQPASLPPPHHLPPALADDYSPTGVQSRHPTEGWGADEESAPIDEVSEEEALRRLARAAETRARGQQLLRGSERSAERAAELCVAWVWGVGA